MADIVVALDQPAARLPKITGGKGAALAKMRAAGLPVPTRVSWQQSRPSNSRTSAFPLRCKPRWGPPTPQTWKPWNHCVALLARPSPAQSPRRSHPPAYEDLGDGVSKAVRSSATAEDQPWASFAGQYDTFLNIIGYESVLHRLLEVWTSLYSTRAVDYRLRLSIPHHSVSMAVVVQQ